MAIIFIPMGYHAVSFKDCVIGLPVFEPYSRPKIYKRTTKRWSFIKKNDRWANRKLKHAMMLFDKQISKNNKESGVSQIEGGD